MAKKGQKLSDKQREEIRAYYASCGNQNRTAREFGVSPSTVRLIIHEKKDEVEKIRTSKKEQWVSEAWATINKYMEHVQSEDVINRTNARDSAILIGTLHDKMLKSKELEIKREELKLKRKEIETPSESRVVIVDDIPDSD